MNDRYAPSRVPTPDEVLADVAASFWLKDAIRALTRRDPLDAARDAALLSEIMAARCDTMLEDEPQR